MARMPMPRLARQGAVALLAGFLLACGEEGDGVAPAPLAGTFALVAENDDPMPSDFGLGGCCYTLAGSITFDEGWYDIRSMNRNRTTGTEFMNSEQGTFTRDGATLSFTRTGGGGANVPWLLGAGTLSADGESLVLLYGGSGPGSNQIRGTFERQ